MRVDKPWGWYKDLERTPNLVIKKIYIKPFSKFHFKNTPKGKNSGTLSVDMVN